jgi:hypothetical protein
LLYSPLVFCTTRKLCYTFHGYGAGKKKQEKRAADILRQERALSSAVGVTGEGGGHKGSMRALAAAQAATGSAFITLHGQGLSTGSRASLTGSSGAQDTDTLVREMARKQMARNAKREAKKAKKASATQ